MLLFADLTNNSPDSVIGSPGVNPEYTAELRPIPGPTLTTVPAPELITC